MPTPTIPKRTRSLAGAALAADGIGSAREDWIQQQRGARCSGCGLQKGAPR